VNAEQLLLPELSNRLDFCPTISMPLLLYPDSQPSRSSRHSCVSTRSGSLRHRDCAGIWLLVKVWVI